MILAMITSDNKKQWGLGFARSELKLGSPSFSRVKIDVNTRFFLGMTDPMSIYRLFEGFRGLAKPIPEGKQNIIALSNLGCADTRCSPLSRCSRSLSATVASSAVDFRLKAKFPR